MMALRILKTTPIFSDGDKILSAAESVRLTVRLETLKDSKFDQFYLQLHLNSSTWIKNSSLVYFLKMLRTPRVDARASRRPVVQPRLEPGLLRAWKGESGEDEPREPGLGQRFIKSP